MYSFAGSVAIAGLVAATFAGAAYAQGGGHGVHVDGESLGRLEIAVGVVHGAALGAAVFLAGVVTFVALVWLPSHEASGGGEWGALAFTRCLWALFALLAVTGVVEVSLYAVRASGEPFGFALVGQAFYETRVGQTWLVRLGFALAATVAATWASREGRAGLWWAAVAAGSVVLLTVTQLGHAATEVGVLPFAADWLHLGAAALWMGGLLGFPLALIWPVRKLEATLKSELLGRAVRRFSRLATGAVMVLVVTGIYAIWLQVPSADAVFNTPYGRALVMKLGLLVILLPAGLINMVDRGKEPFGRMVGVELLLALGIFAATGFLTSLPPP